MFPGWHMCQPATTHMCVVERGAHARPGQGRMRPCLRAVHVRPDPRHMCRGSHQGEATPVTTRPPFAGPRAVEPRVSATVTTISQSRRASIGTNATDPAERAERERIGSELQDIIAHSVSAMVVGAGGARRLLRSDPQRARDARRPRALQARSARPRSGSGIGIRDWSGIPGRDREYEPAQRALISHSRAC